MKTTEGIWILLGACFGAAIVGMTYPSMAGLVVAVLASVVPVASYWIGQHLRGEA